MTQLGERRARVLRAVVHDFIDTAEPVGSKSLADRYQLGVSAATIRNELAALEEEGFLSHPHTSAGRVPTDLGYRFYVDQLSGVSRLARAQEEAIARYFEGAADLEETMQRTSQLLSSLTRYTAMVAPPALDRSRLRHVELVRLAPNVLLLVIILDNGRVEKRLVETGDDVAPETLERWRQLLNARLEGARLDHAADALVNMAAAVPVEERATLDALAAEIGDMPGDAAGERVYVGGQANLSGPGAFDMLDTVHAVYEVLEQQVVMLRLLQAAMGSLPVSVRIGSENALEAMRSCSIVVAPYVIGDAAGTIAVLGPTRMDYLRAMAAVQAVARYLGDVLEAAGQ